MSGTFILSLDCEGRWGVADNLRGSNLLITQHALDDAYRFIFEILDRYNIKATFAFTSLFSVTKDVIMNYQSEFESFSAEGFTWYNSIAQAVNTNNLDGWVGQDYFEEARSHFHEIGWHGFSHHMINNNCHPKIIDFEIKNSQYIAQQQGLSLKSLVFPRNSIGNLESLKKIGFCCYRDSFSNMSPLYSSRYLRLVREFNIFTNSQIGRKDVRAPLSSVPAGEFLNWPNGILKYVPQTITNMRWNKILDHAVSTNGCAHLWFHPHNLITAPAMKTLFAETMRNASLRIAKGSLKNVTMAEYANQ